MQIVKKDDFMKHEYEENFNNVDRDIFPGYQPAVCGRHRLQHQPAPFHYGFIHRSTPYADDSLQYRRHIPSDWSLRFNLLHTCKKSLGQVTQINSLLHRDLQLLFLHSHLDGLAALDGTRYNQTGDLCLHFRLNQAFQRTSTIHRTIPLMRQ